MNQANSDKPLSNLEKQSRFSAKSLTMTEFPAFLILKCQQNLGKGDYSQVRSGPNLPIIKVIDFSGFV